MEVASSFADAFPGEPRAHRTGARSLESVGKLVPEVGEPRSAFAEFAEAQRLERQPSQRIRDAADRVRVLLKAGDFARVRELGDSLLRVAPMPTAGIAGVAVLLGRPTLAHRLLATEDTAWLSGSADNQPVAMPRKAALAGLALLSYAAVGAPGTASERTSAGSKTSWPVCRRPVAPRHAARCSTGRLKWCSTCWDCAWPIAPIRQGRIRGCSCSGGSPTAIRRSSARRSTRCHAWVAAAWPPGNRRPTESISTRGCSSP